MFDGNTAPVFLDPLLDYRRDVGLAEDPDALFYTHPGPKIFRFAVNPVNGRFSDLLGTPWWKSSLAERRAHWRQFLECGACDSLCVARVFRADR